MSTTHTVTPGLVGSFEVWKKPKQRSGRLDFLRRYYCSVCYANGPRLQLLLPTIPVESRTSDGATLDWPTPTPPPLQLSKVLTLTK